MLSNIASPTKAPQQIFPLVNFEMKYTKIYQNKVQKMFRNLIKLTIENIHSWLSQNFTQTRTSPPFKIMD
jgi:hypothetical protein